ncbi:LAME_0G09164g1_1 [Lachancea meyersii CBS 8951]|uniref:LAME_0G09164g1_1 n=1 Tax=Lachancea meyersii CBS 8951 TaxID=1266667 RepID=A0A1G4K8H8_9SACH|nr:LAME_0G09164g1_1 [Lachancea meyersii CBS 8951]
MLAQEVSQEELVFQLANIGGYTAPPKTTTSSDATVTPGSSRSRKWGQSKFQKLTKPKSQHHHQISPTSFRMARKTSDGACINLESTPSWVSNSPSSPSSRSLSLLEVPSRLTTIPHPEVKPAKPVMLKSTSVPYGEWNTPNTATSPPQYSVKSTPPRVKPFDHPSYSTSKKSYLNEPCCLCQEVISCRALGEKVIALECGHLTHEECLMAYFETSSTCRNVDDMFPLCHKCGNDVRCVPSEPGLRDKCISRILMKASPVSKKFPNMLSESSVTEKDITTPVNPTGAGLRKFQFGVARSASGSKKNVKELSLQLSPFVSSLNTIGRGSLISGISSIVSSVPTQTPIDLAGRSDSSGINNAPRLPLTVLRSYYSHTLLENFPQTLRGWELDAKFGLLRIVDRLMFSEDGKTYHDACCYLFADAFLIALVSPTFDPKNFAGLRFDKFLIHHPLSNTSVDSLNSSVLKCTILSAMKNSAIMQGSTFYLTESLESDKSQVVEKWITALLNREMVFRSSNFSSTLPPLPVTTDVSSSRLSLRRTGRKSLDMEFKDDLSNADIIVRNSLAVSNGRSRRTTITSLLSLKRDRPKNLAVVLQLDLSKLKNAEFVALINSLRALSMKMQETKFCLVDSDGGIISQGPVEDQIFSLQKLNTGTNKAASVSRPRFSSREFREKCCPDMTDNVGIAVFSNTPVEDGKTCLYEDYNCFSSSNRSRPQELKVHVGFLNFDHTDRVSELVEVSSFHDILETVCYGFNLTFGEDDDDEDDDNEECASFAGGNNSLTLKGEHGIENLLEREALDSVASAISGRTERDEDLKSELVDYSAYRDSSQSSLSSPLAPSNGTICESAGAYSNCSKKTTNTLNTPRSAINSFYAPIRTQEMSSRDEQCSEINHRRSEIRSLQFENPYLFGNCESPLPPIQTVPHEAVPGWACFVEGFNRALDEAIDSEDERGDVRSSSLLRQSSYNYM